jgi:hypothetical protein
LSRALVQEYEQERWEERVEVASLVPGALDLHLPEPCIFEHTLERPRMSAVVVDLKLNDSTGLRDHDVQRALSQVERDGAGDDGKQSVSAR